MVLVRQLDPVGLALLECPEHPAAQPDPAVLDHLLVQALCRTRQVRARLLSAAATVILCISISLWPGGITVGERRISWGRQPAKVRRGATASREAVCLSFCKSRKGMTHQSDNADHSAAYLHTREVAAVAIVEVPDGMTHGALFENGFDSGRSFPSRPI